MNEFVPLLQTSLWVGLIVWLIKRYHSQVVAVLTAIQQRIERGSAVKAGPFELGQEVRPQSTQEQNERIQEEVQQIEAAANKELVTSFPEKKRPSQGLLRGRYLLVEDLAMRELQAEFGVVINRSVSFPDFGLDGMFARDGAGFGVEVKYVRDKISIDPVLASLSHLAQTIHRFRWRRFTFVLVFVCETENAVGSSDIERIQTYASHLEFPLLIRVYALSALTSKLGIELPALHEGNKSDI